MTLDSLDDAYNKLCLRYNTILKKHGNTILQCADGTKLKASINEVNHRIEDILHKARNGTGHKTIKTDIKDFRNSVRRSDRLLKKFESGR